MVMGAAAARWSPGPQFPGSLKWLCDSLLTAEPASVSLPDFCPRSLPAQAANARTAAAFVLTSVQPKLLAAQRGRGEAVHRAAACIDPPLPPDPPHSMPPSLAAAPRRLAAALDRITTIVTSGIALDASVVELQLQQLSAWDLDLTSRSPSFGADEHAALRGVMAAMQALADDRHPRNREWVLLVAGAAEAWTSVTAIHVLTAYAEMTSWLEQHSECHLLHS